MRRRANLAAYVLCWAVLAVLAAGCGTLAMLRPPVAPAGVPGVERPTTVRWGSPLYGGALRTLLVLPRLGVRDAGELALRVDMTYDVVPITAGAGVDGNKAS